MPKASQRGAHGLVVHEPVAMVSDITEGNVPSAMAVWKPVLVIFLR